MSNKFQQNLDPIAAQRNQIVVKANELIQNSRFNLSLQQQKVVLYLISQITPYDEDFRTYEFSINEFCKVCGIGDVSGKHYNDLKDSIKEIADKSLWITREDGTETIIRWIEKPYINPKSGIVQIKLDEDMKPYLLQLKENFTKYELFWTINFKSKYTVRLYELVKSIHYNELETYERTYTLDEIRKILGAESYKVYNDLKKRVLTPSVEEINKYSDKIVSFIPLKKGRSVDRITLVVSSKDPGETFYLRRNIESKLGNPDGQTTLWDE